MSIEHCKLDRTSFEVVRMSAYKATSIGDKPVPRIVRRWLARTSYVYSDEHTAKLDS